MGLSRHKLGYCAVPDILEDHNFEKLEPVLARCAPDLLTDLIRRKMQNAATCPAASRYWSAIRANKHWVPAREAEAAAARTLHLSGANSDEKDEAYAANQLLMIELRDLNTQAQFDTLIRANLEFIHPDIAEVLRRPTPHDVDTLIARYADGSPKQQHDLVIALSIQRL